MVSSANQAPEHCSGAQMAKAVLVGVSASSGSRALIRGSNMTFVDDRDALACRFIAN